MSCIFCFSTHTANAQKVVGCQFVLIKQATGAGDLEFTFTVMAEGEGEQASLKDGESLSGNVRVGVPATVTEAPTPGWVLSRVDCEGESGLVIDYITGGISIECTEASEAVVTCTFINVPTASNIPTLSEWRMIAAAGLMIIGLFFAVRRRRTDAA